MEQTLSLRDVNWQTPYGDPLVTTVSFAVLRTALMCSISVAVAFFCGALIATLWRDSQRWLSETIRTMVGVMDGIGAILPALAIASALQLRSEWGTAVLVGLLTWNVVAAFLKDEFSSLDRAAFIEAALVLGASRWQILWQHALPHIAPRLVPLLLGLFAGCAGLMGALGFLGIAGDAKLSLGFMLYDAKSFVQQTPSYFIATFIGFAWVIAIPSALVWLFTKGQKYNSY